MSPLSVCIFKYPEMAKVKASVTVSHFSLLAALLPPADHGVYIFHFGKYWHPVNPSTLKAELRAVAWHCDFE